MSDDEGVWRYCVVCMDEFTSATGKANKCPTCRNTKKSMTVAEAEAELQEATRQGKIPQIESDDKDEDYTTAESESDYTPDEISEMFGEGEDDWDGEDDWQ